VTLAGRLIRILECCGELATHLRHTSIELATHSCWCGYLQSRVRRIILGCRHLGAHGIHNNRSLSELSRRLTAADIPTLISLAADHDLSVGVQCALVSQCEAAIPPVREAAVQHKADFLDASDVLNLVSDLAGCTTRAQQKALETRAELGKVREEPRRSSTRLKTHSPKHPAPTAPPASFLRLYPNRSPKRGCLLGRS
jgi:hypothetical protein